MFRWDLGNVPAWFGGASLLLAFTVFGNDRRNQARAQVDRVGVWLERLNWTAGNKPRVRVVIKARNASQLPVIINELHYSLRVTWAGVPIGPGEIGTTEQVIRAVRGISGEYPDLGPDGDHDFDYDHELDKADGAAAIGRVRCQITLVSVTDNAGRTWAVTRKGRAKRLRASRMRLARSLQKPRNAIGRLPASWQRRRQAKRSE